jgi:hypothetical protein
LPAGEPPATSSSEAASSPKSAGSTNHSAVLPSFTSITLVRPEIVSSSSPSSPATTSACSQPSEERASAIVSW